MERQAIVRKRPAAGGLGLLHHTSPTQGRALAMPPGTPPAWPFCFKGNSYRLAVHSIMRMRFHYFSKIDLLIIFLAVAGFLIGVLALLDLALLR